MRKPELKLRKADLSDLMILKYWDTQEHVINANPNDDGDYENELMKDHNWRQNLMAEINGKPIGFLQIIDPFEEETRYWGNVEQNMRAIDIWIGEPEYLGKGYGTQMMKMAFELCFSDPKVKGILIDPLENNIDAIRFYQRLGFSFIEKRKFNQDICDVHFLSRSDYKTYHL